MNIKYIVLILFHLNLMISPAFADSEFDIIKKFQNIDDEHTKVYRIFQNDPMAFSCKSVINPLGEIINKLLPNVPNVCLDEKKQPMNGKLMIYDNKDIYKKYPSYIADMKDGYPEGYTIMNLHTGLIWIFLYQNKKANGESYLYIHNRLSVKNTYKDGKIDGKQTVYHPNGNIHLEWTATDDYKNPTTFYEEDGSLYQGNKFLSDCIDANFKDGKLEGKLTAYKSNGDILFEANYEGGRAISGYCNRPISKYSSQTEKVELTNAHLYKLNNASMNFQHTAYYNLETMTETMTTLGAAETLNPCKE